MCDMIVLTIVSKKCKGENNVVERGKKSKRESRD